MKTMRFYSLLLVFLFCCSAKAIAAKKPVQGPVPAWLEPLPAANDRKPDEREINQGVYMKLIEEQTNVETQEKYEHWIKQIVNESGVQDNAQLSIAFAPDFEQLTFHKVVVRRDGKEINKLDLAKVKVIQQETGLTDNIYTGAYNALLILDDIRKGDQIEAAYTLKGNNPIFNNKFTDVMVQANYSPVVSYSKVILMNAARPLHFKYYNKAQEVTTGARGALKVYTWKNIAIPAYKDKGNTPPWYMDYPFVEMSEFAGWAELAQWGNGLVHHYDYPLPAGLQQLIAKWKEEAGNDQLRFATLATRFVQDQVRYQGMEIGVYSHRPYTPAEVFANRYGDCKDKALLLSMILRTQQIEAWVAFLSTSYRGHLEEHLPGTNLFNHAIVKTRLDNRAIWIDATFSQQRGSIAHNYVPNYGKALVIADNVVKPEVVTSILPASPTLDIKEQFYIPADTAKPVVLKVQTNYDHFSADYFRSVAASGSKKDLEKMYEEFYNKMYKGTTMRDTLTVADNTDENEIESNEAYTISRLWQTDAANPGTLNASFYARSVYDRMTDADNTPDDKPLVLAYPCNMRQAIEIITPEPWSISDETGLTIKRDEYYFRFKPRKINETHIILDYEFAIYADHVPAAKMAQYREDYKKMTDCLTYSFSRAGGAAGSNSLAAAPGGGNVNMLALVLVVLAAGGAVYFVRKMNPKSNERTVHQLSSPPIGGWLVFLGIVLCISAIRFLYFICTNYPPYFSNAFWTNTASFGIAFQLEVMLEILFPIFALILNVALIYWFVKKRDIFPSMFMVLALSNLFFALIQFLYTQTAPDAIRQGMEAEGPSSYRVLGTAIVFLALWGSALKRSPRSQYTFVNPYRYDEEQDQDLQMYRTGEVVPAIVSELTPPPAPEGDNQDAI